MQRYPRDMRGYGAAPPDAAWPNGARIAVSLVLNYEEGGENCLLHGDAASEAFLSEIVGAQPWPGQRHWNMESLYDYGARAGFWRLHRLFSARHLPITVFGVASALARSPEQTAAMQAADWEIASHGLKWVEHKDMPEAEERAAIAAAQQLHGELTGARPRGWYTGRCSINSLRLAAETGEFDWVSDTYDDDLPYWRGDLGPRPQLILPYTLDANDMRFATPQGFNTGDDFATYLCDSFDALYAEGVQGHAKMMSVGLHCRLVGRPGRVQGLARFLDHAQRHEGVWFATRGQIAAHWAAHHPYQAPQRPSALDRSAFVARFGDVFEHSPWVAERAHAQELGAAHDSALGLHSALTRAFRAASPAERLGVLQAHPDLAGKLAAARRLSDASQGEQEAAGLDALSDGERARFGTLNTAYSQRHGFPFIIAVRAHSKAGILAAFERRLAASSEAEFETACAEVERIALLRLRDMLP